MTRLPTLVPVAAALALAFAAGQPAFAAGAAATSTARASGTSGTVFGVGGDVIAGAKVCVDRNANGRCDAGERAVRSDGGGHFRLRGRGGVVAEVGAGAFVVAHATSARTRVTRPLVLRAAGGGVGVPVAVGPLSTELQAIVDQGGREDASLATATETLRARLGVAALDAANADALAGDDAGARAALVAEQAALMDRIANAAAEAGRRGDVVAALGNRLALDDIRTIVVIYAENRSFNNVFAGFPGARSVVGARRTGALAAQKDRDGTPLDKLPPAWGGLTAKGQDVVVTQAQTTNVLPNAPFQIDSPTPPWGAPAVTNAVVTRDLYHRFYENQMQIDGGANDRFAAWADSGGLVMGYFDGRRTALWGIARRYTLADNFFMGAFGGSFLNHQYLVCACTPVYDDADASPAHPSITVLQATADGRPTPALALAPNSPPSALAGPPVFVKSGNLTPKDYFGDGTFHAVNTMQPPFQPSYNAPAADDATGLRASPLAPTTLPVQTAPTIGDMLAAKGVAWTWYAGGWNDNVADRTHVYDDAHGGFQSHHQPFNYYAAQDPAAHPKERAERLKDYDDLVAAAAAGTLPAVAFYKPMGTYNEHPGATSLALGDAHIADLVAKLQAGPQWKHMLVVVTYDENGGQWDEVAPPRGDLIGPGTRIPAVIVSPFARRGFVDHTPYDTGSIARFLTHRFSLTELAGLKQRDDGLAAHGAPAMGDLTNALDFRVRQQAAR